MPATSTSPAAHHRGGRRRRSLGMGALASLAATAGLAAGCGSSSPGGADADPAAAVPAAAPVYLELVVRPEGRVRDDALAAGRKVLRGDPAKKLADAFDAMVRGQGITFARDVEPWLGKRVGLAVTGPGAEHDVVVVAASADDDAASAAVPRLAGANSVERSHDGVGYRLGRNGDTAAAAFEGRVLVGSEAGVRAAIDAVKGDALAETDKLRQARAGAGGDEGLGFLYADVRALARGFVGGAGAKANPAAMLLPGLLDSLPDTVGARLTAAADAVRLDATARGGSGSGVATGPGGARAVAELPGGSLLGLGISDVGGSLDDALERLSSKGIAGVGVQALLAQLRRQTGLDLRRDVLSWMGDAGLFVTGERAGSTGGGLVVQAKDAARMRAAVGKLAPLVRTLGGGEVSPLEAKGVDAGFVVRRDGKPSVYVAAAGERFVIAVGRPALAQAVTPAERLGEQADFRAAAAKLGDGLQPSFYLDVPALTRLLERLGGGDDKLARVRPYLEAFGALVAGARRDGDVTRAKVVAALE